MAPARFTKSRADWKSGNEETLLRWCPSMTFQPSSSASSGACCSAVSGGTPPRQGTHTFSLSFSACSAPFSVLLMREASTRARWTARGARSRLGASRCRGSSRASPREGARASGTPGAAATTLERSSVLARASGGRVELRHAFHGEEQLPERLEHGLDAGHPAHGLRADDVDLRGGERERDGQLDEAPRGL